VLETEGPGKINAELYELKMPGQLLGKEVVDNKARRIGVVRNLRISLPPVKTELIVKGLDVEFAINTENVATVGSVIQLNTIVKEAEEIEIHDILRLRREIWDEIKTYFEG
jgi:sporulation protein YlmC with PRC-barrel domain